VRIFTECPDCGGTRSAAAARSSRSGGVNIADACARQISDLAEWVRGLYQPTIAHLHTGLQENLDALVQIGVGHLGLDHRAQLRASARPGKGLLKIRSARRHNLRGMDVDVPTGILTVVTGVAGPGRLR